MPLNPTTAPTATDGAADRSMRIQRWLAEYDAQGWHRTATAGDAACAAWLQTEIAAAGAEPTLAPFSLQRRDPQAAWVEAAGQRIEGIPLFDAPFTAAEGVLGPLGALGSAAAIGQAAVPVHGPHAALDAARAAEGGHAALLLCTQGRIPGLGPRNAYGFASPFGPPALQVSSEHQSFLAEQAARGAEARLVCAGRLQAAQASNVCARIAGRNPDLLPLLVMTPRSGWWHCAGERGGGLACWLEALRRVAAAAPERDVIFLATSGHELGHLGLDAFLEAHPHLAAGAERWVHLGASIGTANHPQVHAFGSDAQALEAGRHALDAHGAAERFIWNAPGAFGTGEARNIAKRGGRYFSLAGQSDWFHLPCDRWPAAIDLLWLTAVAGGIAALVAGLAGSPE